MSRVAPDTLARLRRLLLLLVLAGLAGTTVDLVFIDHHEDVQQYLPFAAITPAAAAVLWQLVAPSRHAALAVRITLTAVLVTGALGVALHYQGSAEFQKEMDPAAGGWPLLSKTLEATAPPVLAPANLALLGLVGLASLYRLEAADDGSDV